MDFDAIVIGSGFGGAITGMRLAEAGLKVLILERGRRWDKHTFPRKVDDPWIWSHEHPERENGWLDLRVFPRMAVAQGAGVGGGSLIYANISVEAFPETFQVGWPAEITHAELKPYYDAVAREMNVRPIPDNQWTERMKLMREAAVAAGFEQRFRKLDLAVTFDDTWTYDDFEAGTARSRTVLNAQGAQQGTCVHLGNCDIGCEVNARNTLDLNYIYAAENRYHAEVRPLHLVGDVAPINGGYEVRYDRIADHQRVAGRSTGRMVIIAAGSLGSTELLLRCRDLTRSLPQISKRLGHNWSSNGDFLTPAYYKHRQVLPARGPTISSAIDFSDRSAGGESFWIQDGGFPPLATDLLDAESFGVRGQLLLHWMRSYLETNDALKGIMPWFAQGLDAANGTLSLQGGTGKQPHLALDWDIDKSQNVIDSIIAMHRRLSTTTGGQALVPPTWTLMKYLLTPHPLGGCNMAATAADGVVDHRGEVFGYRDLYVADGAIIPEALGVNPSRTIGALAERIAHIILEERH